MAEVVRLPKMSDTMTEGVIVKWNYKVGDTVKSGDILAEVETDKATMDMEVYAKGTLLHLALNEGDATPVDSIIAVVGNPGEDFQSLLGSAPAPAATPAVVVEAAAAPAPVAATPVAAAPVAAAPVSTPSVSNDERLKASPLAKKLAEEKGIDITQIQGSGENGRIVKKDIETFTPAATKASAVAVVPAGEESFHEVNVSQMRKTIARRLSESKFTAPHYYLTIELDMDNAIASRNMINGLPETKVSFNDMVIKASAMALKKHPQVNSQWREDAMVINHHVNIGVAVAVEDGLMVPVLKFTDQMSLTQIGANVKDLAGKAKSKKIQPAEMEGSTFTISNLGMFGIQSFTSIINQPNSAILSVGAIIEKPVVKNGQIVVGNTMTVTLACDHRTVDGATGAQFLQTFKAFMENPVTMLA